jgi:hypothetical protein
MAADRAPVPLLAPPRGLALAWGIHLGLLVVAGTALYSKQSPTLTLRQAGLLALVGLALAVWAAAEGHRPEVGRGLRLLMALGAVLLLGLARAPRLATFLPPDEPLRDILSYLQVNLGTVGVFLAVFFWLGYRSAGGERFQRPPPLQRAALLSSALIVVLALVCHFAFFDLYGRGGDLGTGLVIFQAVVYGGLLAVVLGASGGPLVRRWPAYYLGAALLAAGVLGVLAVQGGTL